MAEPTEGPWRWELNLKSKRLELCGGVPRFDLTVMDFVRWGMGGAAPRVRRMSAPRLNIMERIELFAKVVLGREHHANWFQSVDHPDMRLMEKSRDLYNVCHKLVDRYYESGMNPGRLHEIVVEAQAAIAYVQGEPKQGSLLEAREAIRAAGGDAWDKIEDPAEYLGRDSK
jgi:hypothetical protein